jgi:hypothetical protein
VKLAGFSRIKRGNIWGKKTSVVLDGSPEPDLVHTTGCKQPTLTINEHAMNSKKKNISENSRDR